MLICFVNPLFTCVFGNSKALGEVAVLVAVPRSIETWTKPKKEWVLSCFKFCQFFSWKSMRES